LTQKHLPNGSTVRDKRVWADRDHASSLAHLRGQRGGHIINLSSVGGIVARGGVGAYASSKFAVEAISEALADELKSFGIQVTVVEPGSFRTDFAGGVR
jgi:NAD(P)-dependent dehydrogenase (short-subunit alcohol dehydrogenase family)